MNPLTQLLDVIDQEDDFTLLSQKPLVFKIGRFLVTDTETVTDEYLNRAITCALANN